MKTKIVASTVLVAAVLVLFSVSASVLAAPPNTVQAQATPGRVHSFAPCSIFFYCPPICQHIFYCLAVRGRSA